MNKDLRFLFLLFPIFLIPSLKAQVYDGANANIVIEGAEKIRYTSRSTYPNYISFQQLQSPQDGEIVSFIQAILQLQVEDGLVLMGTEYDELGYMHLRFQQTYADKKVEAGQYIVHYKLGQGIESFNGDYFALDNMPENASLSEESALQAALDHIQAETYKWEIEGEAEAVLGHVSPESESHSLYPKGELVYVPVGGDYDEQDFRLAYKFDIYAHEPMSRSFTYVDANNGSVLWQHQRIHTADT
ncbi:MAG: hypothetical protein AB8H47_03910, partial [Bacteroidia bacterium]